MSPALSAPPLGPLDIHVWRISLQVSPQAVAQYRESLAEDERARANRFRLPEHERRFVVARGFLRRLLAAYLGTRDAASLRFTYGPAGKPQLDHGSLQFNLSHSGDLALVALSREDVGVDLEQIRILDYQAVGRQVFTQDALEKIAGAPEDQKAQTFCRHWVRREAQLKALGLGIAERRPLAIPVHDLAVWPGYCAALATPVAIPTIELHDADLAEQ